MKSSGKIGLIRDKLIRNKIVVLYNNIQLTEIIVQENSTYIRPMDIDFNYFKDMAQFQKIQAPMFGKYILSEDIYEKKNISLNL